MFAGETDGVASKVAVKVPVFVAIALFTKPLLLVTVLPPPFVLDELELEDLLLEDEEDDFEEDEEEDEDEDEDELLEELELCCEKFLKYSKSTVFFSLYSLRLPVPT